MNNLFNILKKELKEMFRDKKSLSMMLVVPIMIPLLVIGMSFLFNNQVNKSVDEYNKIGFNYKLSDIEMELANSFEIKVSYGDIEKLESDYENGDIDLFVTKDGNNYIIHGDDNETTSYASSLMFSYFDSYKTYLQNQYLTSNGVNASEVIDIIKVEQQLNEEENFYSNYIVNYAFLFILMAITVSATYPSTDTTAGEKERGTLETLLTFPIKSRDIIIGKFLGVSISSIITGIVSLIFTVISLEISNPLFEIYKDVDLSLSLPSLLFSVIVIISYSLLISGLCIAVASKSKTFKEAQSALTPLTFISFFPGMVAFMINVKTNILLSFVPFLNYSLLFTDISNGNVNILNIFAMLFSTFIITAIVLSIIIKQYKSERVLFN